MKVTGAEANGYNAETHEGMERQEGVRRSFDTTEFGARGKNSTAATQRNLRGANNNAAAVRLVYACEMRYHRTAA